jgi:hypothetical protein
MARKVSTFIVKQKKSDSPGHYPQGARNCCGYYPQVAR